jgi:hypothetical protein
MNITELRKKHAREINGLIDKCPHTKVMVEDHTFGSKRDITIRCVECQLNLAGYVIDGEQSYMAYVNDCIKEYPGNIRNTEGSIYFKDKKEKRANKD